MNASKSVLVKKNSDDPIGYDKRTLLNEVQVNPTLQFEPYVDADEVAAFLKTNRLKVIRMARRGLLPAHPLQGGKRCQWRFKLSELDKHMQGELNHGHPLVRQ